MTYTIQFECIGLKKIGQGDFIPASYTFWERLLHLVVQGCDKFKLVCELTDTAGLESCARYGARNGATVEIIHQTEQWSAQIDDYFVYELIKSPLDDNGIVKWQGVYLFSDNKMKTSIENYGKIFGVHNIPMDEVTKIMDLLPAEQFKVMYWEDVSNGQTVEIEMPKLESKPVNLTLHSS